MLWSFLGVVRLMLPINHVVATLTDGPKNIQIRAKPKTKHLLSVEVTVDLNVLLEFGVVIQNESRVVVGFAQRTPTVNSVIRLFVPTRCRPGEERSRSTFTVRWLSR